MNPCCSLKISSPAFIYKIARYKFQHALFPYRIIMFLIDKEEQVISQSKYLLFAVLERATRLRLLD